MFDWLYRRIARGVIANISTDDLKPIIQGFLSDEEVQKGLFQFTDAFYDRYRNKVMGTLGGLQKGVNYAVEGANPLSSIIDSRGHISLKGIIPMLAGGLFSGGESTPQPQISSPSSLSYAERLNKYR